jgi:hypothetical protein
MRCAVKKIRWYDFARYVIILQVGVATIRARRENECMRRLRLSVRVAPGER